MQSTPGLYRNLDKANLGGVIFGCTDKTMNECLSNQLFGLPAAHFGYVKHIDQGMPLFLFNYSKRALHGVFEAASTGQMNINPYGWTGDGSERTSYPAQVQIRTLKNCRPLLENQFSRIIKGNYYTQNHFQFELDRVQANTLIALFSAQVIAPSPSAIRSTREWKILNPRHKRLPNGETDGIASSDALVTNDSNDNLPVTNTSSFHEERDQCHSEDMEVNGKNEMGLICKKLQNFALNVKPLDSIPEKHVCDSPNTNTMHFEAGGSGEKKFAEENNVMDNSLSNHPVNDSSLSDHPLKDSSLLPLTDPSFVAQLMADIQELKAFKQESIEKMRQLEQKMRILESEVHLSDDYDDNMPVPLTDNDEIHGITEQSCSDQELDSDDLIYLAGGYDGKSWRTSLESYCPSKDIIKSLCPKCLVHSYASLVRLNGDVYVIGGGPDVDDSLWYDTVECYSPVKNDWTSFASLSNKKGSLVAVTLHDKIFALGGGNGVNSFSDVEMLDPDLGRWIPGRSMLQKRFALGAVELNGTIYAVGGFDGKHYLSSAERFDPREHSWSRIGSMNSNRGCHSMVVLNEKLYAVGGYNGMGMVSSVEVYDPRLGDWMIDAPMNFERGYSAAVVLKNSIYAIGGLDIRQNIVDKVERYEEGCGWQVTHLKAIGKRCFASAIAIS